MKNWLCLILMVLFGTTLHSQGTSNPTQALNLDTLYKSVKWRNIGPFRGGRSVGSSGVVGDPLTYYMGTTGGGLWKTEDAGQLWKNVSDGFFKTGSVGAVAVSESDPNVVYCGMGEHAPRGVMTSYGDGMYKSTDAGKTWKHIGLKETQHIARIVIHPKNPDILYVAAQGALYGPTKERGIYKSTNGGKSWDKILFVNNLTGCSELSMDMQNPNVLYAAMWHHQRLPWKVVSGGSGSGLYKSSDAGRTWKKIHKGLPVEKGKMAIAVSRSNPEKVYALIESDSNKEKGGLFVSDNGGEIWKRISKDHRLIQRSWYYIEVFVDPVDEHTVYVLSAPALRSIDGGKSWERLSGTHGDFHDLWINPSNPKNMVISNDGGAAITFNRGKSWSRQDNMPTCQFYRINVDNLFPYHIYGGQQDNSSVKIVSRNPSGSGISERNWWASAGGESAFLAFDPDDPNIVLGGSYLGTIEALNVTADAGTQIMPAPIQYLGEAARDMRYRYNWNAPIIKSMHEPNTYYHAAQMLLRTRDVGQTWEEASPDLSKNEDDKQGKGGGPYTNEAVGAENYGTISYIRESPHEAGVIWVTTDDGHVQLTKDNGATWTNVTPKGLQSCLVNTIDISPHDPATAYIATTRYKFNDHTPALYKTNDYGKTWINISKGIPQGAFTRVVREDTQRKGLLLAGTETGVYISWNDGAEWHPFKLNLPVTPINDLMIKHDDIIVATSGRSFWVLDDLELLRQYHGLSGGLTLYDPAKVMLTSSRSQLDGNNAKFKGTNPLVGVNPASGAVIYYNLPKLGKKDHINIKITDGMGNLVREVTSKKDSTYKRWDGGPPPETTLSKAKGLNRFVWDLRYEGMIGVKDVYIEGSYRGHKVSPGAYTITLSSGDVVQTSSVDVLMNPTYNTTTEQYARYHQFMSEVEEEFGKMHKYINTISDAKKKLDAVIKHLSSNSQHKVLVAEGKSLVKKIEAWDKEMIQRKSKAYDDVENFPNKFTANWLFMLNASESAIPMVNQPSIDRRSELEKQWKPLKGTAVDILEKDIPAFNKKLWDVGVGAIWK